jgi:hypothetical protein
LSQKWKQPERTIFIEIKGSDVFLTDRRYMIRKEQALEIIQKLLAFYELDDVDEIIRQHNLVLDFSYDGFDFSNRYNRHGSLVYHYTEFGVDQKGEWSFKCDWCNKKVSSQEEAGYYRFTSFPDIKATMMGRTCSEDCARHRWDELLTEFIKAKYPHDHEWLLKKLGLKN